MLLSLRKNGPDFLFKEVRVFKVPDLPFPVFFEFLAFISFARSSLFFFWCAFSLYLAVFYAAYGFTGAFGRNLCKFTFPQRRRNLRKSLLLTTRPTGVKRAQTWLRQKLR